MSENNNNNTTPQFLDWDGLQAYHQHIMVIIGSLQSQITSLQSQVSGGSQSSVAIVGSAIVGTSTVG